MRYAGKIFVSLLVVALPVLVACSSSATSPGPSPTPGGTPTPTPTPFPSFVYYSTDAGAGSPQIGAVAYPITPTSTLAFTLTNSSANGLINDTWLQVDATGRLFAMNDNKLGPPFTISVFTTPLSASSAASIILTLPAGPNGFLAIAFDASGNLWLSSNSNNTIYEFNGPFMSTTTLAANLTIPLTGCILPDGLGFDPAGNLYVACGDYPTGTSSGAVAVLLKGTGFTNSTAVDHFLLGPRFPEALAFDRLGNLYVGSNAAPPTGGIAMYTSANLASGATPNVYDATGMALGYFPEQFAFDAAGNLYDGDCGGTPMIYVYPTATQPLTATLAPSATYTDVNIMSTHCVDGIAIR